MSIGSLNRLGGLILAERDALMAEWRSQVRALPAAANLDRPTLDDHIPQFLEELAEALQSSVEVSIAEAVVDSTPPAHGLQRLEDGFDIEEVVAEYNILRGCIHDLAEEHRVEIRGATLHTLNRVLDTSIGLAVQTYATQRALEVKQRREEYLSFVAHDLRTPLSAVSLSASLLEACLADQLSNPEVKLALSTLRRNVKQIEELVGMVLKENTVESLSSSEKLVRRTFDLWPHVEAVFRSLAPVAATNGTELVNEVPPELVVFADAGMLSRVWQNLVANAIRYAPRGRVVVGARTLGEGAPDEDGTLECHVTDNGAGIPSDRLAAIFEKFESDPDNQDGLGLGLAIVKEFVEAHGGSVTVESREGQGTTFRFTLPSRNS